MSEPAKVRKPRDPWDSKSAMPVGCPECGSPEYMRVRPMHMAKVLNGTLIERESGQCVACLVCEAPYVIAPHRPGGILKRRRVAAGVPIPPSVPRGTRPPDKNGMIDALARDLGGAALMEEPR